MSTDAAFLNLGIARLTQDKAIADICRRSRNGRFSFIVTPNVDHVVRMAREPSDGPFRQSYAAAALRLCDSRILAMLARLCGEELPVVAGSDLTARLFADVLGDTDRIAVVGGTQDMVDRLRARHRGISIAHLVPPMGLSDDAQARRGVVDFVEASNAHYVFLAVGAPQSELIATDVAARGQTGGVGLCVGASLEFITGLKQRAPASMQRMKLEWLHRLASEPRRLWRRYLVEGRQSS